MMISFWLILSIFSITSSTNISENFHQSIETRSEPHLCSYNSCLNGGTCYITGYGKDMEKYCTCPSNSYGERCEYVHSSCTDLCSLCGANGDMLTYKTDDAVVVRCQCKNGYSGAFCDKKPNGDPCFSKPCVNSGECYSNIDLNIYICVCPQGYIGTHCETRLT